FSSVDTSLAKRIRNVGSITDQATGCGPVTQVVDRGYRVAVSQRDDTIAAGGKERIGRHHKSIGSLVGNRGEPPVDFAVATGIENKDVYPECTSRRSEISQLIISVWKARV